MRAICVLAALLMARFVVCAQNSPEFNWQGAIQPGQTIEIRNINGSIRAEPATGDQVELSVRILGTNPPPETIRIHIEPHPGGILACTIYEGLSVPDYCNPDMSPSVSLMNSDIRVEYTVRVPAGIPLIAKTVNGRITAQLPESAVTAETVNGRVLLTAAKHASAKVVNGSILAVLDCLDSSPGPLTFRTVNGSVDVELDESARASVHGSTVFGMVTSEFPIRVRRGFIGARLDGDINGGGPRLVLETVNGSLHLRKK